MTLGAGLTAFTGEAGAGKSISTTPLVLCSVHAEAPRWVDRNVEKGAVSTIF
ncbi:MAG: hypothetical protein V6Z86_04030 [Hyphomicrobiales bacterium]